VSAGRTDAPEPEGVSEDSLPPTETGRSGFQPGQVWWCDGIALAFDPYYKRRPVLIVGVEGDTAHIIPLSSKRRYGQETAVTHGRGVSYMAGPVRPVPATALLKSLGSWDGFAEWQNGAPDDTGKPTPFRQNIQQVIARIKKWWRSWQFRR
jgi:hypothetical protein